MNRMAKGFLICILCLAVFLQILGAPVTFFSVEDPQDPFDESISLGLAVLCVVYPFSSAFSSRLGQRPEPLYASVGGLLVFHPPLLSA
jgi:hypothetical protein